jgi:hypothetical protein
MAPKSKVSPKNAVAAASKKAKKTSKKVVKAAKKAVKKVAKASKKVVKKAKKAPAKGILVAVQRGAARVTALAESVAEVVQEEIAKVSRKKTSKRK